MPEKEHEVGYKNPPRHSQYKPGESGNPKGRPKKSRNITTLVEAALDERVSVREGDRTFTITLRELMAKKAARDAASGNPKARTWVVSHMRSERQIEQEESDSARTKATSAAVLKKFQDELDKLTS